MHSDCIETQVLWKISRLWRLW